MSHIELNCTPLHLAASNEFMGIIDALLEAGAKVDCVDPRGRQKLEANPHL
jgi:ankyrin repeat protein